LRAREEDAGKAPLISYSLLFILLPLAPVLSINSVGDNVFAERYLYLPSVGFAMLAAMAWGWLAGDIQAQSASRFADRQRIAAWSVVAMVVAASAWILLPRNLVWHDDYQLIRAGLDESPNNAVLLRSFSAFYAERKQYDVAIEFLQRATAADPHLLDAWVNLGGAYEATHRDAEALAAFRKAVELDPEDPHMYAAHFDLGLLYERTNSWDAAAMEFSKSLQLMPDFDAGKDALKRAQEMIKQRPDKKPF
jgi:tetratricopeptide (TPR) repeat protein